MTKSVNSSTLIERYPWWSAERLKIARNNIEACDDATRLIAMLHPTALLSPLEVDIERIKQLTTDDIIDRFLRLDDYRIVAKEDGDDEPIVEKFEDEEELVSEEIAEIYKNQGLYAEAIATYRKLSLLNSEKSIYFARLISDIEKKSAKQ